MLPAFYLGHIVGHSSALNVNWAEGFAAQISAGEIYPRWLPEMTAGGGSPVFYFYGPLPFYVATPFVMLTGNPELAVVIASTILLVLSGLSSFYLCRQYVGPNSATVGGVIYMLLPYHFDVDIWLRAALGEQAAFVFMPLCCAFALRLGRDNRQIVFLALSFAGLIFSHLPSTILFAPFLVLICCWVAWYERSFVLLVKAASSAILAAGFSAIYLLPAFTLQDMIQSTQWMIFPAEDYLLVSDKTIAAFSLQVFPICGVAIFFGMLCYFLIRNKVEQKSLLVWVLIGALVIFESSMLAYPLWVHAGFYRVVQFPWRALSILDVVVALFFAMLWQDLPHLRKWLTPIVGFLIIVPMAITTLFQNQIYQKNPPPGLMNIALERIDLQAKGDAVEYLPSCLTVAERSRKKLITTEIALARMKSAETQRAPVYYFPFLSATRDGKALDAICDPATGYLKIQTEDGSKSFQIEKRAMPIEATAWFISGVSFGLLTILFIAFRRGRDGQGRFIRA